MEVCYGVFAGKEFEWVMGFSDLGLFWRGFCCLGVGFSDLGLYWKLSLVFVPVERMDSVVFAVCNGAFL